MGKRKHRRSRLKKLSDQTFQWTGIPLPRLLTLVASLIVLGYLIYYLSLDKNESQSASNESVTKPTPSLFNEGDSEEKKFFDAIAIPKDFVNLPLPVRIERLDKMIGHCELLLSQDTTYRKKLEVKSVSLLSLKCTTMAEAGLDPRAIVKQLNSKIADVINSVGEENEFVYLRLYVNLSILMFKPESSFYDDTISVIEEIDATTPVQATKVVGCYRTALRYYVNAKDPNKALALITALGQKISLAENQKIADYGLALLDYPHYRDLFGDDRSADQSDEDFVKSNLGLFDQLLQTPPQSAQTYNRLFLVPELFLQSGNSDLAKSLLTKIESAAATANEAIKGHVQAKLTSGLARARLFDQAFPLQGFDVNGEPIVLGKKEKTLVLFWDPFEKRSRDVLSTIQNSRLNDRWSTDIILVPSSELSSEQITAFKKIDLRTRMLDFETSKAWLNYSGVNEFPYLITLDQDANVRRLERY